jgi:hypothetical protein
MTKNGRDIALLTGCLTIALSLLAGPATAQKPTPEQIDTIRANCKADFARLCPGVPPGGRALLCLRENIASVSPACQKAVNAVK